MTNSKKQLGQFFTKNSDYILSGFARYLKNKEVTDPFAGSGDLIDWARKNKAKSVLGYDIDKKYVNNKIIFFNDSLRAPLNYKFVLTNPPYLHVNKANQKIKDNYFIGSGFEDLYQIALHSLLKSEEGIIIVPVNFLSADNSAKIRNIFLAKFQILEMNYFKHQVFPDTTYNVIAFYYKKRIDNSGGDKMSILTHIYPENKKVYVNLSKKSAWKIGGDFLRVINEQKNHLGVRRLTESEILFAEKPIKKIKAAYNHIKNVGELNVSLSFYNLINNNIILLKAIDSGTEKGKISLENIKDYGVDCLISKKTSRHMIHLIFNESVSVSDQQKIISIFNSEIKKLRDDLLSLFLTNYRDNDRKRISFDFVYKFINYIYLTRLKSSHQESLLASIYDQQYKFAKI